MNLIANLATELKLALTNPWVVFGFLGQFVFFTRWIGLTEYEDRCDPMNGIS